MHHCAFDDINSEKEEVRSRGAGLKQYAFALRPVPSPSFQSLDQISNVQ